MRGLDDKAAENGSKQEPEHSKRPDSSVHVAETHHWKAAGGAVWWYGMIRNTEQRQAGWWICKHHFLQYTVTPY